MKKALFGLLFTTILLAGCAPTTGGTTPPDGHKTEYSKTEIVFGTLLSDYTADTQLSSYTYDNVSLTFGKGNGSNAPTYNFDDKQARMYAGNVLTISKTGITKIDFIFSGDGKVGNFEVNVGKYVSGGATTGRWTGDNNEIKFTVSEKQRRIMSMTVICGTDPSEETETYPKDTANSYTVAFEELGLVNSIQQTRTDFKEVMTGYIGKGRNELSDFSWTESVQIYHKAQTYQNTVYEVLALVVGSAEHDGSITLTFNKQLKKVKLYSSPNYAFAYDEDSQQFVPSVDGYCAITVNDTEWALGSFDATVGPVKSEKEFTINSNTLTISGKQNQRVYTYAMTFTF